MNKLPIVSIVGRPNVGKSTLFNRIVGFRQAIVSKIPGTTRDRIVAEVVWDNKKFMLIDTAGLLIDYFGFENKEIEEGAQGQIDLAVKESDLILFLVDAKCGVSAQDKEVAKKIRKIGKRVILVANKADVRHQEQEVDQFTSFGFNELIAISAVTGRRTGDLLDLITKGFPKNPDAVSNDSHLPRLAIVGRPNVGKSTLFNDLIGMERSIVSDVPGTTRDSLKFQIKIEAGSKGIDLELIDTAGFRRKGRIKQGVERFSVIRTIESIYKSDIVLLVIDAAEGITRGDAHLAELALDNRKKIIIALNKIDLSGSEIHDLLRFAFITRQVRVAISAKSKTNLDLLTAEIIKAVRNIKKR